MKKTLLIIVCALFSIAVANAQKIHWLLFIDTKDANVGQLDVNGREYLKTNFIDIVNSALKGSYLAEIYDNYDDNCNPYKCKSTIQSLNCGSDDIVVFYYIGHGGRSIVEDDNAHPWPKMWFHQSDPNKMIDLGWVHDQLKAKNPRLLLTIGMCCNVKQPLPVNRTPTFSQSYGSVYVSPEQISSIKNAFLNTCGDLIATSAKPGQPSGGGSFNESLAIKPMDFYTAFLCLKFREMWEDQNVNLEQLFRETGSELDRATKHEQSPVYHSQLGSGQCHGNITNNNCRPMPSNVDINDLTSLENMMDAVVCNKSDMPNRNSYFDNNCVVRIIGQDGKTQVDRVSINTYMLRCRTSDAILRVVPIGTLVDGNDKIKEIYVREYLKKGGIR